MTKKIVWVDEDERIWAPERSALVGLGYDVESISDATSALEYFYGSECEEIKLVILDVMLLQGSSEKFSDERTNKGLNTGIVLAEEIVENCAADASKIVLFSRASKKEHISYMKKKATALNIEHIRKSPITQGRHFIKWLIEHGYIESDEE
jgi:DNA-binding NtrC family response regulator